MAGSINPLKVLAEVKDGGFAVAMVKRSNKGWYMALSPETATYLFEAHQRLLELLSSPPSPSTQQDGSFSEHKQLPEA